MACHLLCTKAIPDPTLTCCYWILRNIDGLLQDFSNSIANILELLQSCTKPSICQFHFIWKPKVMIQENQNEPFCSGFNVPSFSGQYCQISNTRCTLGNKIDDHSDVVGASPVGAASTTSSFSDYHLASMDWAKTTARRETFKFGVWCGLYWRFDGNSLLNHAGKSSLNP